MAGPQKEFGTLIFIIKDNKRYFSSKVFREYPDFSNYQLLKNQLTSFIAVGILKT